MAKLERRVYGDAKSVIMSIDEEVQNSGLSVNMVDESSFFPSGGSAEVYVRVYDKYFMRNGNRASLTVTVVSDGEYSLVSAIGAGGGSGVLFNFSWGAESSLVGVVEKVLDRFKG